MQEFHIGYRSLAEISLEQVSVHIPVYNARGRSLKASLLHATTGGRIANDHGSLTVQALNDISLFIKEGDRVGLIGPNGAGKTTLLKVMAGIYEPIEGKVSISGKVTTLLNANIGVSVEMSGWDNIETRGILLGLDSIRRSKPLVVDVGLVVGSAFAPIVDAERGQSLEARDVDGLSRGDVEGR